MSYFLEWTDDDLVAQGIAFFAAGFGTVSVTASFLAHDLALNPGIQQRLYEEICEYNERLNGAQLDYTTLGQMEYLDMVVSESMRRWSPSGATSERIVTKPYVLENADGTKVQLDVGDGILIPIFALQLDDEYFPDSEKFDPERFSSENKSSIPPGVYMPFGIGPRK